jgi:type III restriction enzyme
VNTLGGHGRWAFEEFRDVYEIQAAFGRLVETVRTTQVAA